MSIVVPGYTEPIWQVSDTYPAPTFSSGRIVGTWTPSATVLARWGILRVIVAGTDVTDFRGGMVVPTSWEMQEPGGDGPAGFEISNAVPHDVPGAGDLTWLRHGNPVDLLRVHPDGSTITVLWSGEIVDFHPSTNDTGWTWLLDCHGALVGPADLQKWPVPTMLDPTDIGVVIADALSGTVSRRFNAIPRVLTGILTQARGSGDQSRWTRATELLGTSTSSDGLHQWTVNRVPGVARTYTIRLKDRTTEHWTVRTGQPGVTIDLTKDATQAPNFILGRGVGSNGYGWGNWVYPNNRPDAAPPYPFSSPGSVISLGTTDAGTSTGTGVSTWQRRVNELNITGDLSVDGVYNANDATATRAIQRHYGILVDGVVGPQTWAAGFSVGSNGADLSGAFRLPLAWDPAVVPRLYNADGSDAGANGSYDASVLRVEADINFGSGVTKEQGRTSAQAQMARDYPAGWVGTVTLAADPQQGSKFDIEAGQNIRAAGWASSTGPLLHIAGVTFDPANLSASLTVDEKARDLLTIGEIVTRNKASESAPNRLPPVGQRRSVLQPDTVVEFDGESPGGTVPDFALYGGLWSVIHIPVSQTGQVASISLQTHGPAAPFSIAFFGDAVTANFMVDKVGNPLVARLDGFGPYDWKRPDLDDAGFNQAIGGPGQAAGYSQDPAARTGSGYQTSPYTGAATPLTGWLYETASWTYLSARPPWLWLAIYSPISTRIKGRLLPAPVPA